MKLAFLTTLFLFIGQNLVLAAECQTCDRSYADCRVPLNTRYVSCMSNEKSSCGVKCSADCKDNKVLQKCMFQCVKGCQDGSSCQNLFTNGSAQCLNNYRICKSNCTP